MVKEINNEPDKFLNPKVIKETLIDAALFLAFYEILKNVIIDRIANFYKIKNKDGRYIKSKEYNRKVISPKGKNENIFTASCLWLVDNNVISSEDNIRIVEIKDERDRIAHNIPKFLFNMNYNINKDLFNKTKDLTLKIEKWWIVKVDIPSNPDFDDKEIDIEGIVPGYDGILSYIYNIANTDLNELDRIIDLAQNKKE